MMLMPCRLMKKIAIYLNDDWTTPPKGTTSGRAQKPQAPGLSLGAGTTGSPDSLIYRATVFAKSNFDHPPISSSTSDIG
jgi:hypothetical protein